MKIQVKTFDGKKCIRVMDPFMDRYFLVCSNPVSLIGINDGDFLEARVVADEYSGTIKFLGLESKFQRLKRYIHAYNEHNFPRLKYIIAEIINLQLAIMGMDLVMDPNSIVFPPEFAYIEYREEKTHITEDFPTSMLVMSSSRPQYKIYLDE